MSHIVKILSQVRDPAAVAAACHRLHLAAPTTGTVKLYSGEATGLIVQLPEWQYPVVIDTASGDVRYDNFNGSWGDQKQIDRFLQMYAVERTKLEARRKGCQVREQALADGSILVQVIEAA